VIKIGKKQPVKKEEIKEEEIEEEIIEEKPKKPRKKSHFIKEVDLIVPVHFIDWNFFGSNLQSWIDELPVKTLYFGCNNPEERFFDTVREYFEGYKNIKFIDQRGIKTLGMQIVDLMKRVKTEFFVYCHADARLTKHSFLIMEAEMMEDDVGMVESEHVNWTGADWILPKCWLNPRSFSGFQLFRKEAVIDIIERIEDDYVYRNEDIIFQNACEVAGFEFRKVWSIHHHYATINMKWTPQGEETPDAKKLTYDMQAKGIVKYCTPNDVTKRAWRDGFGGCIRESEADIFDFLDNFVSKINPEWEEAIKDIIRELIRGIYR